MCIAQEYESKAAEVRAKQAARRGEAATAEGDAGNEDKDAEVSTMSVCLCVLPCTSMSIYMCRSLHESVYRHSSCLSFCLSTFLSVVKEQNEGGVPKVCIYMHAHVRSLFHATL